MDFKYWIILIVIYLVSQWLRRRARAQKMREAKEARSQRHEDEEVEEETGLPEWFKELGIVEFEEEDTEPAPAPEVPEVSPEKRERGEKVADVILEDEERQPIAIPVADERRRTIPKERERMPRRPYGDLIYNRESLRDFIVIREILGPPRALHRHRPLSRY